MPRRPNFLIFMTDQQQAQVIAPEHPCRTPHVERLAAQGVRFTRAYTPAAHCCPSRATFFTGLYPSRHGVYNNVLNGQAIHTGLNPGVVTFGERLREAGYRLVFSGKWHVSAHETPADRGWEELTVGAVRGQRHGISWAQWEERARQPADDDRPRGRGEILRPGWGRYRLYGTANPARRPDQPAPDGGAADTAPYRAAADYRIVAPALQALRELAAGEQPWCLYIGVNGPHDPFMVPPPYDRLYDPATVPLPPNYHDRLEDKPRVYQRQRRQLWDQLGEDEIREAIAHYWGYCTLLDEMLGEVLATLEATGQAEETVVIFLSDHGDYAGAHGLFCKGVPAFDEAYHIPLVIRWPQGIARPGRTVDEFVTLADLAPTLLELAGCPVPPDLSGRSLAPFLRDETPADWPDAFYSQFNGVELYYSQRIVQTKRYKYVFNGFDFDELYDLQVDPHETVNLAQRPEYQPVIREMVARMWRFAHQERDTQHNPYITVGLAPYGPLEGLRTSAGPAGAAAAGP